MKQFLILLFVILSFNSFAQSGFNKTYYIYPTLSSAINNMVLYDTSYFISGITYLSSNTNIQNVFYSNLTNLGDTFNLHVINDTNYYQWGDGDIVKLNSNSIYQAFSVFKLDTSPYLIQIKLIKFNGQDTVWTSTCISDTLEREVFDLTYLDGYFYLTGSIEFPGYTYRDIMLLKTDSLGHLIWMKHFGNDKAIGYQIISTYDHKIMVAANRYYLNNNGNNEDESQWYIMKFDTSGNVIWTHDYGNPTLNDYPPACLVETIDSCYLISGDYAVTPQSINPYFSDANTKGRLLKIDPNGNIIMDKLYGFAPTSVTGMGIFKEKWNKDIISEMGTVIPTDSLFYSASNPAFVLLTSTGKIKWFRQYYYNYNPPTAYNNYEAYIQSVEFTPDGGYIFAGGGTDNNITPAQRGWIVKTDSLGFDGVSTYNLDTAYRIEHIEDTCFSDTAIIYTHLYGVTAPYSITYVNFTNHDSLYYSPTFEKYVADSLIITAPMLTGNDSLIDVICHVTDGLGRTLTDTIHVNVSCLISAINNESWRNDIQIYPNPTNDNLIITINNLQLTINSVSILDITGKKVKSIKPKGESKKYIVNVEDLPARLYFIKIKTNKGEIIRKFVKQ